MQCVVSQRQTRSLFLCVSFGAVFLWVVLGSYTNEPLTSSKQNAGLGSSAHRHLLSASSEDELKGSEPNCAEVELMKVSGGAVDLENDQVSAQKHWPCMWLFDIAMDSQICERSLSSLSCQTTSHSS